MYVQKNTTANTKAEILAELEELVVNFNALASHPKNDVPVQSNGISVVIPFGPSDDETKLIYLIRSIERSLVDAHQIVIVGATPSIAFNNVLVIEHELKSSNAELNLVHAIQAACLNEAVSDKFVVAPLNTYFISPVELADIAILKTTKPRILSIADETALSNTLRLLSDDGIENARNFACLLPFVLEKAKFVGLFTAFPELDTIPTFIESIYYNHYCGNRSSLELDFAKDNVKLNLISAEPNVEKLKELIANKKFVTLWESSAGDFTDNYLNVKFAEKCSLELE